MTQKILKYDIKASESASENIYMTQQVDAKSLKNPTLICH